MTRSQAISQVQQHFDDGRFRDVLARMVARRTESQNPQSHPHLRDYLVQVIEPQLSAMGFSCRVLDNPVPQSGPFLVAERIEDPRALTMLTYGHGDVVNGYDEQWREGLSPWTLTVEGDRWYGRGVADNKVQHAINFAALAHVIKARGGKLGYNVKVLLEMGEEAGSPGLHAICAQQREALAADVFIASDGPRLAATQPTVFLGSRGAINFDLECKLRDGAHHSGNWGGLLRNPGVRLAHAIASLVDARGRILVPGLRPPSVPANVRHALRDIEVGTDEGAPAIDRQWGEPDLTPSERVFAWNALEVLAFKTGNPQAPVNAIPSTAKANCQMRFVVGSDHANFLAHIRAHLDAHGFDDVSVAPNGVAFPATRLDPDDPWVHWCLDSIKRTTGQPVKLLPNLGGSLPNDVFAELLGLPTLWVPHSYPGCSQHAPNEHALGSVAREALGIMAGVFWDLGERAEGYLRKS
jgi:acetylornithine deacetylase/succinyl-diaminopimelate desuccinylase-like protein